MRRFIGYLILPALLLAGILFMVIPTGSSALTGASTLPAPIPGGNEPTIALSVNHGLPGTAVTVSGQGVSPYPGVRVAWLDEETTASLAVAPVGSGQAYSVQVHVPDTAVPGPYRICAAVTGTAQAAFACQNFTVDAPTPGSVSGQLPLSLNAAPNGGMVINNPTVLDAVANLYDRQGNIIASAPVNVNGSFNLSNVPPGSYTAAIAGIVPVVVQNAQVTVTSGGQATFNPAPFPQCQKGSVVAVRMSPSGKATDQFEFGSYVNYWPYDQAGPKLNIQVDMQLPSGATLGLMPVYFDRNEGNDYLWTAVDPPAQGTTYNFDKWVATVDVGVRQFKFRPGISGGQGCANAADGIRRVHIIEHPMQTNALQQYVDRRVTDLVWDGSRYAFNVKLHSSYDGYDFLIPFFSVNGQQRLPIAFPSPSPNLPYLGEQYNTLGAAPFNIKGTIDLDGNITLQTVRTRSRSHILSQNDIINSIAPIFPEGSQIPAGGMASAQTAAAQTAGIPLYRANAAQSLTDQLRQFTYTVDPITLFEYDKEVPVYEGLLFSAAGLADVRISITLGVSGDMVINGTVRPLDPSMNITSVTHTRPRVDITVALNALFGVASGGATTRTEAEMRYPISMNSDDPDVISLFDACMRLKVTLMFWARVNLLFADMQWNLAEETIVDYAEGNCSLPLALMGGASTASQTPPRLMTVPKIASGANGAMLATFVEDTAPNAAVPSPKVMAAFWNSQSGQWGAPLALTDGTRMVQDPVAAFYGNGGQAMVAWTDNVITPAEEQAATGLNDILKWQEIYYATWNGSQWSQPARLTDDQLPDGQAAIAGDSLGITLAWVNDADADIATRTDWRIAVRQWDTSSWSAPVLLNGHVSNAANYQVSADRQVVQGVSRQVLAWTVDTDGSLATSSNRWVTVFDWNGTNWIKDPTNTLPLHSDSASVAYIPGGQDLALTFLRRVNDGSGNNGGLGNTAHLWSAYRTYGGSWQKFVVADEAGDPVRAEQPQVDVSANGEALIVFRRFGAVATNGELGQVALTRLMPDGQAYPPLYLTDDTRQHWQTALGVNTSTDEAVLLNVARPLPGAGALVGLQSAQSGAATAVSHTILSGSDDTLETAVMSAAADPALDPALVLSQVHAPVGSTVTITATVRNVGRADATGLEVKLYAGTPGSGSLLDTQATAPLAFSESRTVSFQVPRSAGMMPVYAQVVTSGGNVTAVNDVATAVLGALLSPTLVRVDPSPLVDGAAQVAWQAPAIPGVAGYRVLRATAAGGPYELVGETTATYFADLLLTSGTTYHYVVQAYDADGLVSPNSDEVTFTQADNTIYLPIIVR
ncbi:MAG TPA: CARDB domain-containing protein [Chloroflexota bacterium]|nr:CARDB domain-containing protein [Chloroflexota bacterium]